MKYKDELIRSMEFLAQDERTIFLGQSVKYSGNAIFNTLESIDDSKKIETPVFEIPHEINVPPTLSALVEFNISKHFSK